MPRLTDARNIQIDNVHCRAICEEVGYHLRQTLKTGASEHPPHLKLLARLRRQDLGGAPSTNPSSHAIASRRHRYGILAPSRQRTG